MVHPVSPRLIPHLTHRSCVRFRSGSYQLPQVFEVLKADRTNSDASSYNNTYQSGGSLSDPTSVPQSYTNDPESQPFVGQGGGSSSQADNDRANAWESRFGWRVDLMGAAAYLGGPVTGEFSFLHCCGLPRTGV